MTGKEIVKRQKDQQISEVLQEKDNITQELRAMTKKNVHEEDFSVVESISTAVAKISFEDDTYRTRRTMKGVLPKRQRKKLLPKKPTNKRKEVPLSLIKGK